MSDRLVLVRVTDPEVTHLSVTHLHTYKQFSDGSDIIGATDEHEIIPIPEDDQHLRYLDMLTTEFARFAVTSDSLGLKYEAAMRLRAWAGLDQEDDNE